MYVSHTCEPQGKSSTKKQACLGRVLELLTLVTGVTANKVRGSSWDHQLSLGYSESWSLPFLPFNIPYDYVLKAQICVVLRVSLIVDWPKRLSGVFVFSDGKT